MNHFDITAEHNIIYAIGTGSKHAERLFKEIKPDDFFDNINQRRFNKYHQAFQNGQLQEFIKQFADQTEVPETIQPIWEAAKAVQNHAIRRKIQTATEQITASCNDYSQSVPELQRELQAAILEAIDERAVKAPSKTIDDIEKVKDARKNCTHAFYSGLKFVDKNAPIQPGDFVIIGARPGVGKSALATSMVIPNLMGTDKKQGLFFCIEMDVRQGYSRISAQLSGVPLTRYISAKQHPPSDYEINNMDQSLEDIAANFPDRWFIEGGISLEEIKQMVELYKPDWILIDYLQLIKAPGRDARERNENISIGLRELGLKTKTAIIGLVQLNRDANGAPPAMSQIKHSGQYEQDATHIFLLDRPESEPTADPKGRSYHSKTGERIELIKEHDKTNKACLLCSKNRNGPPFYQILDFNPQTTEFMEYDQ